MKTTIDIPEPLYKRIKITAVERGQTMRELVLASLERDVNSPARVAEPSASYWTSRKLVPGFEQVAKDAAFASGTDSTDMISEERSSRDDAIL